MAGLARQFQYQTVRKADGWLFAKLLERSHNDKRILMNRVSIHKQQSTASAMRRAFWWYTLQYPERFRQDQC